VLPCRVLFFDVRCPPLIGLLPFPSFSSRQHLDFRFSFFFGLGAASLFCRPTPPRGRSIFFFARSGFSQRLCRRFFPKSSKCGDSVVPYPPDGRHTGFISSFSFFHSGSGSRCFSLSFPSTPLLTEDPPSFFPPLPNARIAVPLSLIFVASSFGDR